MKVNMGICVAVLASALFAMIVLSTASADTIHMNNGVQVQGKVVKDDGKLLTVQVGKRTVRLRKDEIAVVEENEQDGSFDREAAKRAADERDRELTEQYGLNREERQWIEARIMELTDPDAAVQGEAKRALIQKATEKDIFPYLEHATLEAAPEPLPQLLHILAEIDATRALPTVRGMTTRAEELVRAAAIEVLGLTKDKESVRLMMSAMLDHKLYVRMAGCGALAALQVREATPLLIKQVGHADLRLHNYAVEALSLLWSTEDAKVAFETAAEWEQFWQGKSAEVSKTVDLETLEPLVPPGTEALRC